ncbi:MAG: Hpt domain-containing protein [Clostridiales Family XIII bacterium]|jgi:HPt (histidine-containing phosphotransfer) domain-containing protein|nr:Hpt domain-containing protein [Clostridiales Family XIII bacterium]
MPTYIDMKSALARVGGNEILYKKLLGKFENSIDTKSLEEAVQAQDWLKAGEIVHAAKGIAGNLSLTAFYEQCVILMDQLRGGNAPNMADYAKFKQLLQETRAEINKVV